MLNNQNRKIYNLEERCLRFGEACIRFAKKIPINEITKRIIPQFVASGTSLGANYSEASDAESGKDFKHKIGICKKEAHEVRHWLRMIAVAVPELTEEAILLGQEAKELHLIFNSIFYKIHHKPKVLLAKAGSYLE